MEIRGDKGVDTNNKTTFTFYIINIIKIYIIIRLSIINVENSVT